VDLRRLTAGERIAAVGGVLLIVSPFLTWYTKDGASASGWESMAIDDVIFVVAGLTTLASTVLTASRPRTPVPIVWTVLATLPALLAAILAVWRVIDPAPPVDVGLGIGAWLGMAGGLAAVIGLCSSLLDEGPDRRDPAREQATAAEEVERTELLALPPEAGQPS